MKKYYLDILTNKFADFNGRARRKEYWMWTLYCTIILLISMVFDNLFGLTFELLGEDLGYGWLYLIFGIIQFIPGLAVVVRRLHDVGKSGWYYLIILIPLIGFIWILVLLCTDGVKDENKWEKDDEDKTKMRKTIRSIENKNLKMLPKWQEENPEHKDLESKKSNEFMELSIIALGGQEDKDKSEKKILKNILILELKK